MCIYMRLYLLAYKEFTHVTNTYTDDAIVTFHRAAGNNATVNYQCELMFGITCARETQRRNTTRRITCQENKHEYLKRAIWTSIYIPVNKLRLLSIIVNFISFFFRSFELFFVLFLHLARFRICTRRNALLCLYNFIICYPARLKGQGDESQKQRSIKTTKHWGCQNFIFLSIGK